MTTIAEVVAFLATKVPPDYQESWDCNGLQVGNPQRSITKILTTLDVTPAVVQQAIDINAELIVAHHPFIFQSYASLCEESFLGRMLEKLCEHHIGVYVAHTNCDACPGGLNDLLAKKLGVIKTEILAPSPPPREKEGGLGRVGFLSKQTTLKDFLKNIQKTFQPTSLRYVGDLKTAIKKVALCSGSGASLLPQVLEAKVDCYVTGDLKYHQALEAHFQDLTLIDLGHYATEIIVTELFSQWIQEGFKDLECHPFQGGKDPFSNV